MSTPAIKTKIALEGEKEYKAALADINSGLKVLSSEMKLTATKFEENADGIEAMTAKGEILERQILSQKEKIETLKAALQHSADAFGESDKRTSAWKVSLNNAEAELVKMERELENTTANTKGLGSMVGDLADKLGIDLPDGAADALDALGNVDAKTALLAGSAAAAAAAIFEIEKALVALTMEQAEAAMALSNVSQTVNMNVEATQQWDYVLRTVGSSMEDAQGDLSAFQEKIMEAKEGTGEAAEMFRKLGISVVDQHGNLRDTESVLRHTILALQKMGDETERNATSSILLGGTGEKLIPIYEQNAESLGQLLDKKKELGVLSEEEIEALNGVSQAMLGFEERTKHAKDTIAAEFAPALSAFFDGTGEGLLALGESTEDSGLVNFFGAILELVSALTPALDILGSAIEILEPAFVTLSVTLGLVADGLSVVVNLVSALANLLALDFEGAGENWDGIKDVFSGNSAMSRAWENAWNASGDYNFDGGFTWVGENGPELAYFPQGTRIFNNQESRDMGGDTFYVTIDAKNVKEFNDVVAMAQEKRRRERMG